MISPHTFTGRSSRFDKQSAKRAFTLLEVILAIAITGFVLAAATSFVVSISRIWVDREERHFFEDHVDGVTEFLNACFSSAGMEVALGDSTTDNSTNTSTEGEVRLEIGGDTSSGDNEATSENGGLLRSSEEPVGLGRLPGSADYEDPLISFKLIEVPPLLINLDDEPIIGIEAFIHFEDGEGLSLLWYSILQEEVEDINDLRRTEISQLVTDIQYVYWDEKIEQWEVEDKLMEGEGDEEFLLPRFIKLTFEYEGETKERSLTIPVPSTSALLF
ncbi:MAG: type II secretion system GspH family protein [Opitutales bacterium]|nr:type II secretion system GspH family protein [Opitutales bacterium]